MDFIGFALKEAGRMRSKKMMRAAMGVSAISSFIKPTKLLIAAAAASPSDYMEIKLLHYFGI